MGIRVTRPISCRYCIDFEVMLLFLVLCIFTLKLSVKYHLRWRIMYCTISCQKKQFLTMNVGTGDIIQN